MPAAASVRASWPAACAAWLLLLSLQAQAAPVAMPALDQGNAESAQLRAESRLLDIIRQVERRELDGALQAAAQLTADVPHFRGAQLVYADLLRFRQGLPALDAQKLVAPAAAADPGGQDRLGALQEELRRRLQASAAPPPPGSIPRDFLHLGPSVRHAIAVDAGRSRLYLFANEEQGLRLIADFYVSVGRLGTDKREEGDQRTPLGVYFITRQIPGGKLPDLYGKGALTLNYPNDWDRLAGRSGSGIWLHGSPSDQFARLPQASDGCLVLANPDLEVLMQTVARRTPVLIRERLDWIAPQAPERLRVADAFMRHIDAWEAAWRSPQLQRLDTVYEAPLLESQALQARQQRQAEHLAAPDFVLQDVSVYSWSDAQGEVRVVNLRATSQVFPNGLALRQYWRQVGGAWKIFSEDVLS
ncbi:hypothetical protein D8I35_18595 [Corticibacter populi]|uniref:L,D-TPase catalytic domain-containing protein n=1 Tax=Corticibacter populi TaxID=1550736 RepID=A0A3M6QGK1_9BURK|nr:L,D-transpeptidase family protein [Corticibacter populi]RMX02218.1 hypothetical protein D8I35_18595 [Corticibacter populi]RZS29514.1 L,D-transpeptidase-like protein [Corticibacter populi]